jgi:ComF family protein
MEFDRRKIREISSRAEVFLLDLIFPIECLACGSPGRWICPECFRKIRILAGQTCFVCKRENIFGRFCRSCRVDYALDGIWLATDYEQKLVAAAIKNLKYRFVKDLSADLAKILALFLRQMADLQTEQKSPKTLSDLNRILVIPVPLHPRRLRWRGFNQAGLIAEKLADILGCSYGDNVLVRSKYTAPQTKLDEAERRANIKNCFALAPGAQSIKDRSILLVDDVITTGATVEECAKVLKRAGAREVYALAIAKG